MNIKSVLRTYSLLRQLSDDETALLETLRAMNDSEREALVETLSPQPVKKAGKKSASKKSSRASGMAQAIKESLDRGRAAIKPDDDDSDGRCSQCDMTADMPIHDPNGGYISHHPFSPTAPTASDSSSANGGAGGGTRNLEDETESVAVAVGGSNE